MGEGLFDMFAAIKPIFNAALVLCMSVVGIEAAGVAYYSFIEGGVHYNRSAEGDVL